MLVSSSNYCAHLVSCFLSCVFWLFRVAVGRRDFHPHFTVAATETYRNETISLTKVTQGV
jgi:hypothetical protein